MRKRNKKSDINECYLRALQNDALDLATHYAKLAEQIFPTVNIKSGNKIAEKYEEMMDRRAYGLALEEDIDRYARESVLSQFIAIKTNLEINTKYDEIVRKLSNLKNKSIIINIAIPIKGGDLKELRKIFGIKTRKSRKA